MTDIGKIVMQQAYEQHISIAQIAKQLNMAPSSLYRILQRKDLKISHILQLSQALNHNLLQYYQSTPSSPPEELKNLQHENQQLKQQLQTLQRENNLLTDFVEVLKVQVKKDQ
jgi:IS30 family transposase